MMAYKQADKVLRSMLIDAIVDLCRKQSFYVEELRIEATVCIVSDRSTVVIAQITEQVGDKSDGETNSGRFVKQEINDDEIREKKEGSNDSDDFIDETTDACDAASHSALGDTDDVNWNSENDWNYGNGLTLPKRSSTNSAATVSTPASSHSRTQPSVNSTSTYQYQQTVANNKYKSPRVPMSSPQQLYPMDGPEWFGQAVYPSQSPYTFPFHAVGSIPWETPRKRMRIQQQQQPVDRSPAVTEMDGIDGASIKRSADGKFACPYCEKAYGFKHTLKDHINKHLGRRPHMCKHCPVAFTHLASLCAHVKRCHDDIISNDHQCALCGEKFTNDQSLKQHHTWRHRSSELASAAASLKYLADGQGLSPAAAAFGLNTQLVAGGGDLPSLESFAASLSKMYRRDETRQSMQVREFKTEIEFDDDGAPSSGVGVRDSATLHNCGNETRVKSDEGIELERVVADNELDAFQLQLTGKLYSQQQQQESS